MQKLSQQQLVAFDALLKQQETFLLIESIFTDMRKVSQNDYERVKEALVLSEQQRPLALILKGRLAVLDEIIDLFNRQKI